MTDDAQRAVRGPQAGSRTVLVVDDEVAVLTVVAMVLEAEGFRVLVAGSEEDGCATLAAEACDLVICDATLARTVREAARARSIPMIETSELPRGDALAKPLRLRSLLAAIARALG